MGWIWADLQKYISAVDSEKERGQKWELEGRDRFPDIQKGRVHRTR